MTAAKPPLAIVGAESDEKEVAVHSPTRMPTLSRLLVIATAAALVLAGCGADDDEAVQSTAGPTATAPSTTVPAAVTTTTAPVVATTAAEPVPVSCDDMELTQAPDTALTFYAVCGGSGTVPFPVYRPGRTQPTLGRSLQALVDGTTPAERAVGLHTGFDGLAGDIEVEAGIDADGIAHVALRKDGAPWLPDTASWSSDQLNSLIDPLWATVFAHDDVGGLDMTTLCFEQIACDRVVTRAEWAGMLFTNTGAFTHGGCTPELAWWHPERCTLGSALAAPTVAATVTGVTDDDVLNVRSGPGTEFFTIGELPVGAAVVATKEAAAAHDGGVWRLVDAAASAPGWVNEAFLDVSRTAAEELVDAFVAFAHDPTEASFADLPLAAEVELGLGPTLLRSADSGDLAATDAWVLDLEHFRAYTGPFSALDMLSRLDVYDVTVGDHPHCASPPVPAPAGYEDFQRIGVQPRLGLESSCLMWATVDLFVLPDGNVAAITLDMWEP